MVRNVKKALEEYRKISNMGNSVKGRFYYSDFKQIEEECNKDYATMVFRAMEFGFVIGYRTAKRDIRTKKRGE